MDLIIKKSRDVMEHFEKSIPTTSLFIRWPSIWDELTHIYAMSKIGILPVFNI